MLRFCFEERRNERVLKAVLKVRRRIGYISGGLQGGGRRWFQGDSFSVDIERVEIRDLVEIRSKSILFLQVERVGHKFWVDTCISWAIGFFWADFSPTQFSLGLVLSEIDSGGGLWVVEISAVMMEGTRCKGVFRWEFWIWWFSTFSQVPKSHINLAMSIIFLQWLYQSLFLTFYQLLLTWGVVHIVPHRCKKNI